MYINYDKEWKGFQFPKIELPETFRKDWKDKVELLLSVLRSSDKDSVINTYAQDQLLDLLGEYYGKEEVAKSSRPIISYSWNEIKGRLFDNKFKRRGWPDGNYITSLGPATNNYMVYRYVSRGREEECRYHVTTEDLNANDWIKID